MYIYSSKSKCRCTIKYNSYLFFYQNIFIHNSSCSYIFEILINTYQLITVFKTLSLISPCICLSLSPSFSLYNNTRSKEPLDYI